MSPNVFEAVDLTGYLYNIGVSPQLDLMDNSIVSGCHKSMGYREVKTLVGRVRFWYGQQHLSHVRGYGLKCRFYVANGSCVNGA